MAASSPASRAADRPKLLSLRDAPKEFRIALLKELGYSVEGNRVILASGEKYHDPYSGVEVSVDSMVILPGRSPPLVLDDSPLSLASYVDEYGDIF